MYFNSRKRNSIRCSKMVFMVETIPQLKIISPIQRNRLFLISEPYKKISIFPLCIHTSILWLNVRLQINTATQRVLRKNVPIDKYEPAFFCFKLQQQYNKLNGKQTRTLDEVEIKPSLLTDGCKTEMVAGYGSCVFHNDYQMFTKKVKLQQQNSYSSLINFH